MKEGFVLKGDIWTTTKDEIILVVSNDERNVHNKIILAVEITAEETGVLISDTSDVYLYADTSKVIPINKNKLMFKLADLEIEKLKEVSNSINSTFKVAIENL